MPLLAHERVRMASTMNACSVALHVPFASLRLFDFPAVVVAPTTLRHRHIAHAPRLPHISPLWPSHLAGHAVQMQALHGALLHALTTCHLFDRNGHIEPFTFANEFKQQDAAARRTSRFLKTFKHVNTKGPDGDEDVADVGCGGKEETRQWPHRRIGDLGGPDAGRPGVPDVVVRAAWEKATPWLHLPLPEWWAFKVRP
jgi:hypothetical protein